MKNNLAVAFSAASLSLSGMAAHAADVTTYREPAPPPVQDAQNGVKIGYLECDIAGGTGYVLGSAKEVECIFRSISGEEIEDRYTGEIRKLGVDIGFTMRSRLIWAVFAPTAGYHHGSLSGLYKGASAEATVGAGIGANVLVGGTSGSIHLQTVSVTGQLGLNVAAAGTSMTLNSVN
ncbi:DUF992 domain-containing protein [Sinorhizobium numidicum]|uniref:DUF992 domain-containing protein n=1 Tax=Sinorhizobium numidicum TaxID=680248 RepID=A0ABY8CSC2_9HYPH|nr:DUF992 domain-containing protein [Sinorhizobium numidicum]WEX74245.1 DUF992 domain-containing protein [Sinorhizobium numidicum]WEX80230.1 DUF992 domain-containing protein [Sinorhizobium numidicum]